MHLGKPEREGKAFWQSAWFYGRCGLGANSRYLRKLGAGISDQEGGEKEVGRLPVGFLGDVGRGEGRLQLVFCCSIGDETGESDLEWRVRNGDFQLAYLFSCSP